MGFPGCWPGILDTLSAPYSDPFTAMINMRIERYATIVATIDSKVMNIQITSLFVMLPPISSCFLICFWMCFITISFILLLSISILLSISFNAPASLYVHFNPQSHIPFLQKSVPPACSTIIISTDRKGGMKY